MEADEPIIIPPLAREVPLTAAQMKQLEELAAAVAEEGFSPSAGQVANVLIGWALAQLGPDAIKEMSKGKQKE